MAETIRVDPIGVGAWSRAVRTGSEVVAELGSVLGVSLAEAGSALDDRELAALAVRAARNARWRVELISAGLGRAAGGAARLCAELVDVDARVMTEVSGELSGRPESSPAPSGAAARGSATATEVGS